jgi:hypothetical protein
MIRRRRAADRRVQLHVKDDGPKVRITMKTDPGPGYLVISGKWTPAEVRTLALQLTAVADQAEGYLATECGFCGGPLARDGSCAASCVGVGDTP